ncbi:MAG: hypothetical protein EA344_07970 [Alkalicoccus sp.]|jgi:hypothetical protein|uniref:Uncharacterized protein n=1 Tax=Alkalicoccus saliphilus TaxID=200989 RepID=A0A2T4U6C5_9BACI|nr:hypothetical protein [Alkalicoccus saliphilus]PTL38949.1 hypothetical protein C6Y45_08180 [Alkalicoccus saliphilus]TVP83978.1 MAG: hypothetical protein EA344_07970 [Alkalicoccus sp.]
MYIPYILFAMFYLFIINTMTNNLVVSKEIPEEKHQKIFRTVNILITILITTSFVRIYLT